MREAQRPYSDIRSPETSTPSRVGDSIVPPTVRRGSLRHGPKKHRQHTTAQTNNPASALRAPLSNTTTNLSTKHKQTPSWLLAAPGLRCLAHSPAWTPKATSINVAGKNPAMRLRLERVDATRRRPHVAKRQASPKGHRPHTSHTPKARAEQREAR